MAHHPSPQCQPSPQGPRRHDAAEPFPIASKASQPRRDSGPQPAATETLAIEVAQPRPQLAETKQIAQPPLRACLAQSLSQSSLQARPPQSLSIEVEVKVATQAQGD